MTATKYLLEICASSHRSAHNAQEAGAHRVELCQNLEQGGITPSYGLVKHCVQTLNIPIHVLIRPRPGNFVYNDDEFEIMLNDINMCHDLGVAGVVVGALNQDHTVDIVKTKKMVETAQSLHVTFHRAIEDCADQVQALEDVVEAGCQRILTSGLGNTATEKLDNLCKLIEQAEGRVEIMPGGGVTSRNIQQILAQTGAKSVHASAKSRRSRTDTMQQSKFDVEEMESSTSLIEELVDKLKDILCRMEYEPADTEC